MSSDPEDFGDNEEPDGQSLEGILIKMLVREFMDNQRLSKELEEQKERMVDVLDQYDDIRNQYAHAKARESFGENDEINRLKKILKCHNIPDNYIVM